MEGGLLINKLDKIEEYVEHFKWEYIGLGRDFPEINIKEFNESLDIFIKSLEEYCIINGK